MLACVDGMPIGVDVERRVRVPKNRELIQEKLFHGLEQDWLRSHGETMGAFLQIFCLKEAWVKALGGSALRDFKTFSVIDARGAVGHPDGWLCLSDAQPDLYVAVAVAKPGAQPDVRWLLSQTAGGKEK